MKPRNRTALPSSMPLAALAFFLTLGLTGASPADPAEPNRPPVLDSLVSGTLGLNLRYRFEGVRDDDPRYPEDGLASTLRTSLSYRTGTYMGFSADLEFESVADLGLGRKHNNLGGAGLSNGVTDRPAVADPELTEVNQVSLRFDALPRTTLYLGRREASLANQRFLGPVGWRQNHQSFDGLWIVQNSIPRTTATYMFLHNVNRIQGDNHPMASHLLDFSLALTDRMTVAPFFYYLDYERPATAGLSTMTVGLRAEASLAPGPEWEIPLHAQSAWQRDAGDNPDRYDVSYYDIGAGVERNGLSLRAGLEILGGRGVAGAFSTPLATLHKFNGWADKFLNTPADGLQDLFLSARAVRGGTTGVLTVHRFTADHGDATYGSEVDAELSYRTTWKQTIAVKFALYNADTFSLDTEKMWIYSNYAF